MTLYVPTHVEQGDYSFITRVYGCTWTSLANGIRATTGGFREPSPDYLHSLVPRSAETDPNTPGWSLPDARLAASKYGMALQDRSGQGISALWAALNEHHYCLVQGDSDQFGNDTCSGAFDGDHCIGVHPNRMVSGGVAYRWINDPICPKGRWARESTIRAYAQDLNAGVRFAAFLGRVPEVDEQGTRGDGMARAIRTEGRKIASGHVVRVRGGAKLYRSAEDGGKGLVRTLDASTLLDDFGVPTGTSGFRAVRLISGSFDSDDDREGGIALVREADVTGGPRPKTDDELAATRAMFRS